MKFNKKLKVNEIIEDTILSNGYSDDVLKLLAENQIAEYSDDAYNEAKEKYERLLVAKRLVSMHKKFPDIEGKDLYIAAKMVCDNKHQRIYDHYSNCHPSSTEYIRNRIEKYILKNGGCLYMVWIVVEPPTNDSKFYMFPYSVYKTREEAEYGRDDFEKCVIDVCNKYSNDKAFPRFGIFISEIKSDSDVIYCYRNNESCRYINDLILKSDMSGKLIDAIFSGRRLCTENELDVSILTVKRNLAIEMVFDFAVDEDEELYNSYRNLFFCRLLLKDLYDCNTAGKYHDISYTSFDSVKHFTIKKYKTNGTINRIFFNYASTIGSNPNFDSTIYQSLYDKSFIHNDELIRELTGFLPIYSELSNFYENWFYPDYEVTLDNYNSAVDQLIEDIKDKQIHADYDQDDEE